MSSLRNKICYFEYRAWNPTSSSFTDNCGHPKNPVEDMVCTGTHCPYKEPMRSECPIAETLLELNLTRVDNGTVKTCGWPHNCRVMENRKDGYYPECSREGVKNWGYRFLKAFNGDE